MKSIHIFILLFIYTLVTFGQEPEVFEKRLYDLYVDDNILEWKDVMDEMEAAYRKNGNSDLLYALCFARYGYIGHCISKDKGKAAEECLADAMKNTDELALLYANRHDVLALQGALMGFQIMLSKFSALSLGPKAYRLVNTASASSNIYFNCSMEIGNLRYFTPKIFGGSKKEAIDYYENAVELLEAGLDETGKSWIYINTMLLLAHAYYDTKLNDIACIVYSKILNYEPEAIWIRNEMNERCK